MTTNDEALDWVREELKYLWNDLAQAERLSLTGNEEEPSAAMVDIMERIKTATTLVGPIAWENVPIPFFYSDKYKQWANYMGIEYDWPTEEEFQQFVATPFMKMQDALKGLRLAWN